MAESHERRKEMELSKNERIKNLENRLSQVERTQEMHKRILNERFGHYRDRINALMYHLGLEFTDHTAIKSKAGLGDHLT